MKIINVTSENMDLYPPTCFQNTKTIGYIKKSEWIKKRFKEGLKFKLLLDESDNKIRGFMEYIDGKNAWRAVDAEGYIFIHCLWVSPNKYKEKGYGSLLIKEALKDAKKYKGAAVIVSEGAFMASSDVFLKNGFKLIEESGKDQLLVKQLKKAKMPRFRDYKKEQQKFKGWNIVYTNQCPWVARFVEELDPKIIKKLNLKIKELKTPKQIQSAPSVYTSLTLLKDGKVLADRYISNTRFNNILKKEAKK